MTLHIAPDFSLPNEAVTETFGILAKRRVGKSNAAVVMAEEMYDNGLPWVAVDPKGDWWGIRAAGDGKAPGLAVLVFGGRHGDVPLEPAAGRLVADLIVEHRLTCVLDVSEMTKADQRRFLLDFATRLYAENREPLHIFCEEADEYCPQRVMGEDAKLVRAFEVLVKRGGFRGIGVTLITQRSASLNNDVLTQVETLISMRTTGPPDRKAISAWVNYHEAGADAVAELPKLANGEAWVFSPQWLDTVQKIRFRRRRTFDSGATPKIGEKVRPPAKLAEVDLASIKEAMAETIEKAKADDPRTLRSRIRQLERQLAEAKPDVQVIEVPVVSEALIERLEVAATQLTGPLGQATDLLQVLRKQIDTLGTATESRSPAAAPGAQPARWDRGAAAATSRGPGDDLAPPSGAAHEPAARHAEPQPTAPGGGGPALRSGARRMVEALGRMAPLRLTKSQWGTVARLKTSSGTWSTYLGDIRRAGFLDENPAGYTLTEAGFEYLGHHPEPMSAAELQEHYRTILRAGAAKMFDALISAYPAGLSKEDLGAAADIVSTSGTFSTYVSDLVRNGLAERHNGMLVATDILMRGADL